MLPIANENNGSKYLNILSIEFFTVRLTKKLLKDQKFLYKLMFESECE